MRTHYYIINSREDRMIGQSRLTLEKTEGWGNQDTLATFGTQDAGPRQTKLKKHNTEKKMSNTDLTNYIMLNILYCRYFFSIFMCL